MGSLDELILSHFPYSSFFPGQFEAIKQIVGHFNSGQKFVLAQVPTGVGKSVIAYTVHKVLKELNKNYRTTVVTVTKSLQDQYVREFSEILDLKGKANYNCPKDAGPYNSVDCRQTVTSGRCDRKCCPYLKARDTWKDNAQLRLTNTSFMIEASDSITTNPEVRSDLIVVDECHTLDTHLVKHSTVDVELANLQHVTKIASQAFFDALMKFYAQFFGCTAGQVLQTKSEKEKVGAARVLHALCATHLEEWDSALKTSKGTGAMAAALEELQTIADKLNLFCNTGGEWIVQENTPSKKIVLKPVYASQVSELGIFRKADKFLLMSATICGFSEYARNLGIEKFAVVDIVNPIPVKSRPVYACDLMKVAGDFDKSMLVRYIDKLISREKGNGIIHTVSYALAEHIKESSRYSDRMLVHRNMADTFKRMESKDRDAIILSPSMEQGYDFKGDIARWQIIAKYPHDFLGDPWIKLNTSRSQKWYGRRGVLRVVQASGRAVRGVDDWANTYIVDSEFVRSLSSNRDLFPVWFVDSVVKREDIPFLRKQ